MPHPVHVINGGLRKTCVLKGLKIIAAPANCSPVKIEAQVFEEDTFLIMSDEPEHMPQPMHPIRLMNEIEKFTPEVPGTVIVKGRNPIRMLAVVHDVNQDPTWKEEWIEKAMCSVFQKSEQLKIKTLGLPMLGTKHGQLNSRHFAELLARFLRLSEFKHLKLIWLIAPVPVNKSIIDVLNYYDAAK